MKIVENKPKQNVNQATKIQVIMRYQNVPVEKIAQAAGVKKGMISKVIWGVKKSPRVRGVIASQLGFNSWEELMAHKEVV